MFDLIKKALLTGVGLAVLTKDKVEELARDLADKGKLTEKEGRELIDHLMQRSAEARRDLETRIQDVVRQTLEKLEVATKKDVDELAAKIDRLRQQGGAGPTE